MFVRRAYKTARLDVEEFLKTDSPRSGQSNEASSHPDAAQTSACSKYTRPLVGLRRSFVRQIRTAAVQNAGAGSRAPNQAKPLDCASPLALWLTRQEA